ncbi:FYVE, RhoGEF and PH domain-containing protein 4-like [Pungitius pungitius]|uniref:FYVE, RhoGEF and PH domain-containing protein 4-like n=1 Tax=Pungitius pungitius TaxID=134920 RepID=UPI002E10E7A2
MFDVKKRNSLTLNGGAETEDLRRGPVRRTFRGAAGDCLVSDTVLPKRKKRISGCGVSVSCVEDGLGSPRPIGEVSPAHISPATRTRGIPHTTSCPHLGSPSPGKRGIQTCSPSKEGGHSPAKLSLKNHSPLSGLLRTPSPLKVSVRSYSPGKNSKSWSGLHRISSSKLERREKESLSVPELVVYFDDSRISTKKVERPPLKPLQSPNGSRSAPSIVVPVAHRLSHAKSKVQQSSNSQERFPGQMDEIVQAGVRKSLNGENMNDNMEEGRSEATRTKEASKVQESKDEHNNNNDEDEMEEERRENHPKDEEDKKQKLYNIANELLQTERAYVARLHLLDQVFCSRLTEEAGRGSFPHDVIRNIFANISSIYSFHSQFLLPDLENCISQWGESPRLGGVLLQHAPFLRIYADYILNFEQAMELLRTWSERSSVFRDIIQDIQSQEVCGSLTLQHHMLEPVQRVPRYEMLLGDYLKRLPSDSPDYDLSHKSLQIISMAATHSNSALHKAERRKRLLEIYEMVGEEEVVNPTNEFLREGRLLKLAARNTSAMERHLFLFNNFLLCCTPKFSLVGQRFTVRCRIGVDGMQVQQTTNEDHLHSFQVSGKERTLELQASSEQDRDEWIKVIKEAIDVFLKKHETFKLACKEPDVEESAAELGRRAPRWIRDNEVTVCMKCEEPFNPITRRRHHCRACGCVVCWKCSDNKVALEYDGNKLNKVCTSCFAVLMDQTGERMEGQKRRVLEAANGCSDCAMRGFLRYGDNPKTWQQMWALVPWSDPAVLHLYTTPQDLMPISSIPLLGCSVEDSPQELQGQPCFRLRRSQTSHTFSCDNLDLKQSWLTALNVAVMRRQCGIPSNGSRWSITGCFSDGDECTGEEFLIIGDNENKS